MDVDIRWLFAFFYGKENRNTTEKYVTLQKLIDTLCLYDCPTYCRQ